ncbi:NUDIX hydrolase [Rhizobium laguerreae]|uniref:NUDIX hydrolase n=1 Tax=Rhizobium laguerreae TaxID=1076926 RepID=UPI001C924F0A|nr:NUDIX hydrolase [Rhizobium laguerreae]MBY3215890.1 NUDIX hydrolase [Rhizobium laguerreae]
MLDEREKASAVTEAEVQQAGAICLRRSKRELQVLLVTSRRTGRWGLPKGHVEPDETTAEAAAREAFEEGGVRGKVSDQPFGSFHYVKGSPGRAYRVTAHVIVARSSSKLFPEQQVRRTKWFPIDQAVREAANPGLQDLLSKLAHEPVCQTMAPHR